MTKSYGLIDIARQICAGMKYLHEKYILHRNLKSSYVYLTRRRKFDEILDDKWEVKITNIGFNTIFQAFKNEHGKDFSKSEHLKKSIHWLIILFCFLDAF